MTAVVHLQPGGSQNHFKVSLIVVEKMLFSLKIAFPEGGGSRLIEVAV